MPVNTILLGIIAICLVCIAFPIVSWYLAFVRASNAVTAIIKSGEKPNDQSLRLNSCEYSAGLKNLQSMGFHFRLNVTNQSTYPLKSVRVYVRLLRQGRQLPDGEATDTVDVKGGINSGESMVIVAQVSNSQLGQWDRIAITENERFEVSLDQKAWVSAKVSASQLKNIDRDKNLQIQYPSRDPVMSELLNLSP